MISPNALQQWIDFYNKQMPRRDAQPSMWGSTGMEGDPNYNGEALSFAQRMAAGSGGGSYGFEPTPGKQQMPDYFAGVPNGNPQAGPGVGMGPMAPQAGYNRLAQLMGRR